MLGNYSTIGNPPAGKSIKNPRNFLNKPICTLSLGIAFPLEDIDMY